MLLVEKHKFSHLLTKTILKNVFPHFLSTQYAWKSVETDQKFVQTYTKIYFVKKKLKLQKEEEKKLPYKELTPVEPPGMWKTLT